MLKCYDLLCEYRSELVGTDEKSPRFSWKIKSDKTNVLQTAYEIEICGLWSSGKINSDICTNITYAENKIKPFTRYIWRVRVWDNYGNVSDWTESFFETALIDTPWQAKWITTEQEKTEHCPVFRKKFIYKQTNNPVRIYATALGNYEITLNGKRVGDSWLTPGYTSYRKHLLYQTYIPQNLIDGENEICITVADGWCRGRLSGRTNIHTDYLAAYMQICELTGNGNANVIVKTDESWEYDNSAYITSQIYDGETYDASYEKKVFAGGEHNVKLLECTPKNISAQQHESVKITQTLSPKEIFNTPKGETVIDFGQNMVGWVEFNVSGKEGDRVILSFAEVLDKDGNFYTENMRSAKNHVEYILKGGEKECYHPHMTFEGFRYVRIDEYPAEIKPENFKGLVIHTDFKRTGTFECSDKDLNQLYKNVIWGQKGNFVDIPTDCPQRDERLGWTGDAQVFIKTAALNYNVAPLFEKWLTDLRLDQSKKWGVPMVVPNVNKKADIEWEGRNSAAWSDAATICPWEIYRAFNDKRILEKQFESMCDWVEYMHRFGDKEYLWEGDLHYGDWLAMDSFDGSYIGKTSPDFIAGIFYAHSAKLTSKAAKVLGKDDKAQYYSDMSKKVREEFIKEYITPNGRLTEDSQTAYALALFFDMTDKKDYAIKRLAELVEQNGNKLTTGFVGTPYLCHALTENGRADLAYELVLQREYPSWLYSVSKGATTIWEHWDGIKPDGSFWSAKMNSYNHYAYGAIADWLYTKCAGINYDENNPGYRKIIIKPIPNKKLKYAKASVETMYGSISSGWEYDGNKINYRVEIPAGAQAEFIYPDGKKVNLGSGKYNL